MKHRILGRTGISVSEIGFGCGNNGGIVFRPPPEVRAQAVQRALEMGINYFDTAPQYGQGLSEENLGQILKDLHARPYVATKVRLTTEDMDNPARAISDSVSASLRRLQRDYVDVLLVHNPVCLQRGLRRDALSLGDVLGPNGVMTAMEGLRAQGKTRFLGFTGLGDTEALHALVRTRRFDVVQCYFNILNPSAVDPDIVGTNFSAQGYRGLMSVATSARMGVLGIRVLAAGAFSGIGLPTSSERPLSPGSEFSADVDRGKMLQPLLGQETASLPELAFRYALGNGQLSSLLIGFAQLEHIDEAAAWANKGPLPGAMLESIRLLQWQDFRPKESG